MLSESSLKPMDVQSTHSVLMVKPKAFNRNPDCLDNKFMPWDGPELNSQLQEIAERQWHGLHDRLLAEGLTVVSFLNPQAECVDAHFPNNWFSTHGETSQGRLLCLYPMRARSRQAERIPAIVDYLKGRYEQHLDFTWAEDQVPALALEGTGSFVLDRRRQVAYMAISARSDVGLARAWAEATGYRLFTFHTNASAPVYHTNVMMALGSGYALVCLESVEAAAERQALCQQLAENHQVIPISSDQMRHFCGNVLELSSPSQGRLLVMSSQAFEHFAPGQKATLGQYVDKLVHEDIAVIEYAGGGSVRCMLAEMF